MVGSFKKFILLLFACRHTHVGDHSSQKEGAGSPAAGVTRRCELLVELGTERESSVRVANILGHCAVSAEPTDRMSVERMNAFFCLSLLLKPGCPSRETCVWHKYSLMSEAYSWRCASH